ncbi:MAG: hypothetical protein KDJ86_06730 [Bauldia sp.]|uniref:carbohydrate kinase family protein n=1 Tax=Bauldia sp. TaxID=2575872 RepID=UPI001D9D2FFE|nr:PfkB family carbohydrate kinase [Bauldia sp.]MCB1487999.1 hypothetical protein [Bauldia sp.]MCB1495461.1 hypothetical protein [Bauldia sp.]
MTSEFATLGNITIDDLVFPDGSTMWCSPGGNAVYSALGIAIWGEKPDVIAPIGPEYPTESLEGRVDLARCRRLDRNLRNWGLYEEDGTRTFTFRSKTRDWRAFSPSPDDVGDARYRYVHLAPLPWDLQITFAEHFRATGAQVISVDPDDRYLDQLEDADFDRLLAAIDLFLPSLQDATALFPGSSPSAAIAALRKRAPEVPVIAVKCGSDGVLMHAAGSSDLIQVKSAAVDVVDATGAGDAFSGGALLGYARTGDPVEAVLHGSVSASYAVAVNGPGALVRAEGGETAARLERLRPTVEMIPF